MKSRTLVQLNGKLCLQLCRLKDASIRKGIPLLISDVGRAHSLVGYSDARDVHYRAPEICLRKGHDLAVDLWSFGVIVFELLTGKTPLDLMGVADNEILQTSLSEQGKLGSAECEEKPASNPHEQDYRLRDLHSRMLSNADYVRSLESIRSVEGKEFIKLVLCVEPYERWPCTRPLTHHDFFDEVDFESIEDGNTLVVQTHRRADCMQGLSVPPSGPIATSLKSDR